MTLTVVEVTRVDNALLFDSSYGSAGGSHVVAEQTLRLRRRSQQVRTSLCTFAGTPDCPAS